jgi:Alr-MurF fusion protein
MINPTQIIIFLQKGKQNMKYSITKIATILQAKILLQSDDVLIENLITDSRKLLLPQSTLFFAMAGQGRNGNSFIQSLYEKDVTNFVVEKSFTETEIKKYPKANFIIVENALAALQNLVAYHREQFNIQIIGITGSNGKTIVKEWLHQLLSNDYNIVRSPKSYNSQVGVPLSVWRLQEANTLGIFEAGISLPNEMQHLQKIIQPTIGLVTFIGSAHDQGFDSMQQKIQEKLKLFIASKQLIFCADEIILSEEIIKFKKEKNNGLALFTWSKKNDANLFVKSIDKKENSTTINCTYQNNNFSFSIPFTDDASIHNAITCCCTLLLLHIDTKNIAQKMLQLKPMAMRLELKQGINNCSIINDAYSADFESLSISLDFLAQQNQHTKRTVILSDVLQASNDNTVLYKQIAAALVSKSIDRLIGIGKDITANAAAFNSIGETILFADTETFLAAIPTLKIQNEVVLLKGARVFQFEKISAALEQKVHETKLEINLNAIRNNLKVYQQLLQPTTKIMAMVKAFGYGSGSYEIANVLQHSGVGYLAVAYTDEGVELRKAGITLPIMVMNAEPLGFQNMVKYNLEPEIYSFEIYDALFTFLTQNKITQFPIHIKIDTGMRRLGFDEAEVEKLCNTIQKNDLIKIVSVFSHLAGSDAKDFDDFTNKQFLTLQKASQKIETAIGYTFINHIANSSAIYRFPALQMDMVRLGIGLYGVDVTPNIQNRLLPVATLKTTIAQIKHLHTGETIGYSRKAVAQQETKTATVRIGYADGYPRNLSNGKGKMYINGNTAAVIGNICMDMTMIDVTGLDVQVGDEVIVFGDEPTVSNLATWADTISYEILTNISQRVKRVYFEE